MSDPSEPRPVPGPPRPGPGSSPASASEPVPAPDAARRDPFAGLNDRPVAEHVAVYEAEHARLGRELGTIDQL
jgi:hypothetical protein